MNKNIVRNGCIFVIGVFIHMKITENGLRNIIQESINKVILKMSPRPLKPLDVFIAQAKEIHGDKYDFSKVKYDGTDKPITIICPEHGEFSQKPHHHLQGQGCRACIRQYKLETRTTNELKRRNMEFMKDGEPFEWFGHLELDFYIPYLKCCNRISRYTTLSTKTKVWWRKWVCYTSRKG